jgi:ferredoxin, 2Fe-2S
MPRIHVTTRTGETRELSVAPSGVLMEALRDADIDGIQGLCGGCCSCATCHVHVDPIMVARLPPASADEKVLMSGLLSYSPSSRLSCQIPVTDALDGLRLTIPAES